GRPLLPLRVRLLAGPRRGILVEGTRWERPRGRSPQRVLLCDDLRRSLRRRFGVSPHGLPLPGPRTVVPNANRIGPRLFRSFVGERSVRRSGPPDRAPPLSTASPQPPPRARTEGGSHLRALWRAVQSENLGGKSPARCEEPRKNVSSASVRDRLAALRSTRQGDEMGEETSIVRTECRLAATEVSKWRAQGRRGRCRPRPGPRRRTTSVALRSFAFVSPGAL